MKRRILCTVIVVLFAPLCAQASVRMTEIMYDLAEGSDTGREWIEVHNDGTSAVDFSLWKLFENNSNHTITMVRGGVSLPPNGFAVIADNADKFMLDWPSYNGQLFDSSFSLSNTGETLVLKDGDGNVSDSVSYTPTEGAAGDGKSLQLVGSVWSAAAPTPGAAASGTATPPPPDTTGSSTETTPPPQNQIADAGGAGQFIADTKTISADAGTNITAIVGADVIFRGQGFGTDGDVLEGADFHWNFGDGTVGRGDRVTHVYRFLGEYIAVLTVSSGKYSASDSVHVVATPSPVRLGEVVWGPDGFIELRNTGTAPVDLSLWHLAARGALFTFSTDTRIAPNRSVRFPNSVTGLLFEADAPVTLLYPSGVAALSDENKIVGVTVSRTPTTPPITKDVSVVPAQPKIIPELGTVTPEQLASAAVADALGEKSSASVLSWVPMLGLILILGVGSVIFIRRGSKTDSIETLAQSFTITEE